MTSQTKRKHSETFNTKELYDLEGFDLIRQWLNANKDNNNRLKAAITYQGFANWTPFHHIVRKQPPLDIIQKFIKHAPEVLNMKNYVGSLPIHYACNRASLEVIQALLTASPDTIKVTDNYGNLPLHRAIWHGAPLDVVNLMIESYPEGVDHKNNRGHNPMNKKYAKKKDDNGMLPLHHACKNGYSNHLIHLLIKEYPDSINIKDNHGRTPFDYYTSFQGRQSCDEIIALLQPVIPQTTEIGNELVQQSKSEVNVELSPIESNINMLKSEMAELKSEMKGELNSFKASVTSDMTEIKSEMMVELNAFKASVTSDMTEIKSEMMVELNAFKAAVQSDMTEIKSMLRQFGAI